MARSRSPAAPAPAELHCHSAYSFGDGASDPAELAATAADLGYGALALTDHDNVCGAMEFAHACAGVGIRPIAGAELTVELPAPAGHSEPGERPGTVHVTLLVESARGWRNLCRLLTIAHRGTRPHPGRDPLPPSAPLAELERHSEGLVCLSGCARDGLAAGRWERGRGAEGAEHCRRLLTAFGPERFRVELQRPLWRRDRARNRWLSGLAEALGVPTVATGGVHAHVRSRSRLQDALVAARLGATLEETEAERRGNSASVLLGSSDAASRFADHPGALDEAARLAERLRFDLTRDLGYSYPGAEDGSADRRLAELCRARLDDRYGARGTSASSWAPTGSPGSGAGAAPAPGVTQAPPTPAERAEAERRLEEELRLIRRLGLSGFFLLHHDMLELAREIAAEVRGPDSARALLPPGRGRGSSVSSIVCYLTGLSHIDPVRNDLFLGRFLNEELSGVPDIDLDFPRDIRERLIPRVHERYGRDRSALVAAFATYRPRGAIRDLGRALGLAPGEVERLARSVDSYGDGSDVSERVAAVAGRRAGSPRWRALGELIGELCGLPRHLSQHPGGMVISTMPLDEICPIVPAAMEGRQMVQWDKDSCADAGFLKIDLLGLGMLSAVERCVEEIARSRDERIDLSRIPLDDERTWRTIQSADTTGVFQIESRAQMQMLPRTRPENLDDLTVQVALVRPGPIQGGAVHPYIERRRKLRDDPSYEIPYEHPSLEPVLRDTLGAIVFQDQVLEVSMALAGFSVAEAESLRRAMSRKRSEAAMLRHRRRFIEGALERGVSRKVAESVFSQIEGFSGFGFPKSHSTAFGLLAYQSTWLRVRYGPEFLCALLNEQPMGFYPPDSLVHDAQRRGIEVLGPDVNASGLECRVETTGAAGGIEGSPPVRIGLGYVAELPEADAQAVLAERAEAGAYESIADLASRSGASRTALLRLAWAGACDRLVTRDERALPEREVAPSSDRADRIRRPALWQAGAVARGRRSDGGGQLALPLDGAPSPELPELGEWERVVADYRTTGMTLERHPMELLRPGLPDGVVSSAGLDRAPDGSALSVAGLVVARQRPATANGVVFMLLEDELGTINLIVAPPVVERHRETVRGAGFVIARGRLERREGTVSVVVRSIERLDPERPPAKRPVTEIEPDPAHETGRGAAAAHRGGGRAGRGDRAAAEDHRRAQAAVSELVAALPPRQSFGRRGR